MMRHYRSKTGPFAERPYYKLKEIENICSDALQEVNLYPSEPGPVRIERFIEKRFGVRPIYDDLPEGLLGYTKFGAKGVEGVFVARALSEEGSKVAERRINTTLAHEGGHGLLHAHLFALEENIQTLFGNDVDPKAPKILCRGEGEATNQGITHNGYDGRWWEYQANLAMGPLLLPKLLVEECLRLFMVSGGLLGFERFDESRREEAIRLLSDTFDVNPAVARIRLSDLYPASDSSQLTL